VQRLLASICCLLVVSIGHAESVASLPGDIAPQPLAQALVAFAKQTGLQLVYVSDIAAALESKGARAAMSVSEALTQLLQGTGLEFEFLNARTVHIYAAPEMALPAPSTPSVADAGHAEIRSQVSPARLGATLVTATRREEQVNHVPMSIALWTQESMEASGIKSMTEIGALTPGVEFDFFPEDGAGIYTNVAIRGVNDRNGTTVGVFLDDTPMPAPGEWGGAFGRPFPVTFDLDRVEVLRGPQGTLLGEGTEAGAVRFIVNQPSLTTFTGLTRTEFATTARGDPSYEVGVAFGGPLVPNHVGGRVSAWYRSDGGYVDRVDPFTGGTVDENANRSLTRSIRGALTFAPTERVHITPSFTYQSVKIHDSSSFYTYLSDLNAGELENGKLLAQPVSDTFYLASLKFTADLGVADFTSVTSYFYRSAAATVDATNNSAYSGFGNPLGPEYPVAYSDARPAPIDVRQNVLSQEVRLTSSDPNASLVWLAGAFYSRARNSDTGSTWAIGMEEWGTLIAFRAFDADQTQLAGYGQIGLRITKRITADIGLRIGRSEYESAGYESESGAALDLASEAGDTTATPKFALSYQADADNLFYMAVANGYRMGGVNVVPPDFDCSTPPDSYAPDSLWSYEIGAKNRLLGGRVQLDTSLFHVSWSNPQLLLATDHANTPCAYTDNAGHATSKGFDLALQALLTDRARIGLSVAYTDAHYTQTVSVGSTVIVGKGDALGALPIVPSPWNATASVEYDFALTSGITVNARAEDVFHSRNPGPFTSEDPASLLYAPDRRPDPSTNILNLRANWGWPSFDLALFVNNALDSQPTVLRRNRCCFDTLFYAATFRPRTIGVTANWRF